MTERKDFGEVFGDRPNRARPEVTLRRVDTRTAIDHCCGTMETPVAIYWGKDIIALVDLIDIFDDEGNRFHND